MVAHPAEPHHTSACNRFLGAGSRRTSSLVTLSHGYFCSILRRFHRRCYFHRPCMFRHRMTPAPVITIASKLRARENAAAMLKTMLMCLLDRVAHTGPPDSGTSDPDSEGVVPSTNVQVGDGSGKASHQETSS
jgi:hypothetical protein